MKNKNALIYLRNLVVLLVFSLAVLIPGTATAAGNAVVSVSVPVDTIDPGEYFTVSINVIPNNAIAGMQFNLSFNPAVVTVDSIAEGNLLNQGGASTYFSTGNINNAAGTVTGVFGAIISPGQTVSATGTFAVITMTAGSSGGTSPLTLSNVVLGDASSQPIQVTVNNGTISIEGSPESPPPAGGGGGIGGGSGGGGGGSDIIDLRGLTTGEGEILEDIVAADSDQRIELQISQGTIVTNKYGQALTSLRITPIQEGQSANPGSVMIIQSYEIEPSGTTFEGSAILVFRFSIPEIPADIPLRNLYIALWDPDAMTWTDLGGTIDVDAGTVSIPINHLSIYALMAHNRPANLVPANFLVTPSEVDTGEATTASIEISNEGDLTGTYQASLTLDGTVIQSRTITLDGGASETVAFTISTDSTGLHEVSLGGFTTTFTVKEPTLAAAFTISELVIEPDSVYAGEKVNINIRIINTGDLTGVYTLLLSIDDIVVETREITLDGSGSMTAGFNYTTDIAGTHRVNINGLEDAFEVKPTSVAVPEIPGLELNSFSTTPVYNETTDTLVSVRIEYEMNQSWASLPDSQLEMMVFYNGEILEYVHLFTLGQVKENGIAGELSYIPLEGWKTGEYGFQATLYDGERVVQDSLLHNLTVSPGATAKVVSWWTLGAIIGIASVLMAALLGMVIYRRRDMLRY